MSVIEVKEAGAKHLTEQDHAVIYIYADRCTPCEQYAPKFLNVSEKLPAIKFGKFKLPKDEPSEFKRTWLKVPAGTPPYGTPTTLIFKKGELIGIQQGAITDEENLAYFCEHGVLPPKPVNPIIAALSDEIKQALLTQDNLVSNQNENFRRIEQLSQKILQGGDVDNEKIERALLMQENSIIAGEIQEQGIKVKEMLAAR